MYRLSSTLVPAGFRRLALRTNLTYGCLPRLAIANPEVLAVQGFSGRSADLCPQPHVRRIVCPRNPGAAGAFCMAHRFPREDRIA